MKRFLCLLLLTAMLCTAVIPLISASAKEITVYDFTLISGGKSYTTSTLYTTAGGYPYPEVDGEELTNGTLPTDQYGTEWIAFDYRLESPMYIIMDLGEKRTDLGKFRIYLTNKAHSGIDRPEKCDFYVSDDGNDFTKAGSGTYETPDGDNSWCTLTLEKVVSGRYVKVDLGTKSKSGVFVFCGEFEAYSVKKSSVNASELGIKLNDKSTLTKDGEYLTKLHPDNKVGFVMAGIENADQVTAYSADGTKLTRTDALFTGDYLVTRVEGQEIEKLYVVVEGDIDGDGSVTTADYILSKRIEGKTATVTGAYLKANTDFARIKSQIIGDKNMYDDYPQKPIIIMPEGVNVTVPDIDTDGKYAEHTMSITKNSDVKYTMKTTASNGKALTLTFDKKSWGPWNIGTLTVGGIAMAGTGTDWEYVFRAKGVDNSGGTGKYGLNDAFIGGNHGQETFHDITFYNGVTGEKLDIANGKTVDDLKVIKIVEHTTIFLTEPDKDNVMNVTRTYTLYGETITLDCDFELVRDTEFSLSYTCMFPVAKSVGQYIMFNNADGTSKVIETLEVGKSDYSGTQHKDNPALECIIWGKKNTDYAFSVKVKTPEDSVNGFKNTFKTSYWDMNTTHNKLYFSRFPDSGYEKVKKGTEWHTSSEWTLFCLDK